MFEGVDQLENQVFEARLDILDASQWRYLSTPWEKTTYILKTLKDEVSLPDLSNLMARMDNLAPGTGYLHSLMQIMQYHVKKGQVKRTRYNKKILPTALYKIVTTDNLARSVNRYSKITCFSRSLYKSAAIWSNWDLD